MTPDKRMQLDELMALARASAAVTRECACAVEPYLEWTRVPVTFPEQQMKVVGTLLDDPYDEPTFAEFHPTGTHYWSPNAPIALRHYPANRCTVVQCTVCGRGYLKYVEAGGYYVEARIRALDPQLIVDAPV
jgi:hypothetical protein